MLQQLLVLEGDSSSYFQGGAGKATEIQLPAQAVERRRLFSSCSVLTLLGAHMGLGASPGPLSAFLLMLLQCSVSYKQNKPHVFVLQTRPSTWGSPPALCQYRGQAAGCPGFGGKAGGCSCAPWKWVSPGNRGVFPGCYTEIVGHS